MLFSDWPFPELQGKTLFGDETILDNSAARIIRR